MSAGHTPEATAAVLAEDLVAPTVSELSGCDCAPADNRLDHSTAGLIVTTAYWVGR
jgi:hypothetical protein